MALVFFTIKMEACTKDNGDSIACKAKANSTINLESLPMKGIGSTISLKVSENYSTNILNL